MAGSAGRPRDLATAQKCFLTVLSETASVSAAARASGVSRASWYRRRKRSARFAEAWAEALDQAIDRLEEEALRRALAGTDDPVFYQGRQVGSVRRYSDALLMFLLRAHRPYRYRERAGMAGGGNRELRSVLEAIDGKTRGLPRDRGEVA